MHSR